jgi:hypothetical protein
MIIPAAWPHGLNFFGLPLVVAPSPGPLSGGARLLPIRPFDPRIGLTRASAAAVDGPRATGLTEHRLCERARARVVGLFAGCPDRDGHGHRLDS